MAGCVFGYFAGCTVVMPVSPNCYTAKCGRRNAEVRVASMGVALTGSLALAAEPTCFQVTS